MAPRHPILVEHFAGRRRFLEASRRYGLGVAAMAQAGGLLFSEDAVAQLAKDDAERQKNAKVTMIFATEYKIEDWVRYPVMQARFKENVEQASKGYIYVKLHPAGQLGIGGALAQKIQAGTVNGGAVSLSNFSPFSPVVDMINIPYWCGENQKYANLVTSRAWEKELLPKVMARGFKPMFYYTVDPRTVATRRGFGKVIKAPSDMRGMKMRVPPSQLLQTFYRLAGANPTVVAWGETPAAMKQGVADALDPAVAALATFGFADILETISTVRSVPDAQMFAANFNWYQALPDTAKTAFNEASEKTMFETFAQIEKSRTESMRILSAAGVKFYNPTPDEFRQWVETTGESRKEWDEHKIRLAGSIDNFNRFKEAANTKGPITVGDYKG